MLRQLISLQLVSLKAALRAVVAARKEQGLFIISYYYYWYYYQILGHPKIFQGRRK